MRRHSLLVFFLIFSTVSLADNNVNAMDTLNQDMFRDLTSDLGAALGYKAINPGQPLGTLGFDIGFDVSSTRMDSEGYGLARHNNADDLLLPNIYVVSGLPFGMDVGGFYTSLPSSDIALVGGRLGYALHNGNEFTPMVFIRGTYTRLTGVRDLSLSTRGLELAISKGFNIFTPYAGFGTVWIDGESSAANLEAENLREEKYFLGFSLDLGLINFAAETEQTGNNTTTSAKFGARF